MTVQPVERPIFDSSTVPLHESWIVVVYNNEVNTWEEVVMILMIATHCSLEEAEIETWEIDRLGKSVVHCADQDECEAVAAVIRQIGIQVEVKSE